MSRSESVPAHGCYNPMTSLLWSGRWSEVTQLVNGRFGYSWASNFLSSSLSFLVCKMGTIKRISWGAVESSWVNACKVPDIQQMVDKWEPLVCYSYFSNNNEHISSPRGIHVLVGGVGQWQDIYTFIGFLSRQKRKTSWKRLHLN